MDGMSQTRPNGLVMLTIGVLLAGVVLAYSLPAVRTGRADAEDSASRFTSLADVTKVMQDAGAWSLAIAHLGVLGAIVAALAIPREERTFRALCVSVGAVAAMAVPLWVARHLHGAHLGAGMITAWLAFAAAAALPWWALRVDEATSPRRAARDVAPPSWMDRMDRR